MHHPDQQYIDALVNNDTTLLRGLYDRCASKIKAMVLKNNGSETDAADIFQDALLAIYQKAKASNFILTCPIEAYLYLICKNRWINELNRRGSTRVTFTDTEGFNHGEDTFKSAEQLQNLFERKRLLLQKMKELGDGCRKVLELSWSGLGMEEVAKQLNNSYGYVRKKKSECMAKLINLVKASPAFAQLKW
jgi:RNA polymerase sigma factor (sigma-70 family)